MWRRGLKSDTQTTMPRTFRHHRHRYLQKTVHGRLRGADVRWPLHGFPTAGEEVKDSRATQKADLVWAAKMHNFGADLCCCLTSSNAALPLAMLWPGSGMLRSPRCSSSMQRLFGVHGVCQPQRLDLLLSIVLHDFLPSCARGTP